MQSLPACEPKSLAGFTLIELSIVLVIIGLIVGGVLVGRDLIRAAEVRATISQIERYNAAVNTFRGKYNALPGDMNFATAVTFGFSTLGRTSVPTQGQGDGNGIIDGGSSSAIFQCGGETGAFWVDISSATAGSLVNGGFNYATEALPGLFIPLTELPWCFPAAKLGRGNFIYVYELLGNNYYGLSYVTQIVANGSLVGSGNLSPAQAYSIDAKMDDGFPNSGNVIAYYVDDVRVLASANASPGVSGDCWDSTGATSGGAAGPPISVLYTAGSTFYNALLSGSPGTYLTGINNGEGAVCGLSFKFQ